MAIPRCRKTSCGTLEGELTLGLFAEGQARTEFHTLR